MEDVESKLSSRQKGIISENRVAEMITLASAGNLSCFKPISDDDGLDLIVCPKGEFKPLFIQIKSRFKLQKNRTFIQNVGIKTFSPHKAFCLIFMLFNERTLEVDALWLVPSLDFQDKAYLKKAGENYKEFYRFTARASRTTKDKWGTYLIDKSELVGRINRSIDTLYGGSSLRP